MIRRILPGLLVLATAAVWPSASAGGLWYGGGIGVSFGSVDTFSVSPIVGYTILPRVSVGGGLDYRYRKDTRIEPTLTTRDYGASVFTRVRLTRTWFLEGDYEYLDYEYRRADGSTGRSSDDSLLGGVGYVQPIAGRASFFVTALYNFSYSDSDTIQAYSDPWVVRAGISVGF